MPLLFAMSGFEIAGLVLAGAQIGGSIISKLSSGGSYQEVTTTTRVRHTHPYLLLIMEL